MHICFITNEYPKPGYPHGGIGTFVKTFSSALAAKNCKVSVVGINNYDLKDEEFEENGVNVYRIKPFRVKGFTWLINSLRINSTLKKIHYKNPISIIETPELGLAFLKKLESVKYVIRLHGGHHFFAESENRGINWWKGYQEKKSFSKAEAFIAVSNYVKAQTSKYLDYRKKPIKIIRYPIDFNVFKTFPNAEVNHNLLLFAGTVCEKKGIRQLILSLKTICEKYPETVLEIYGRDWFFKNGRSYIEFLKNEVIPLLGQYSKNVVFRGVVPIKELAKKYAKARLCVFPSLMETQGLVAPEAMAVGKVVLFSELGPGRETISHKKTGLLCNPYDVNNIADNIIWALENPRLCSKIEEAAKSFANKTFGLKQIVEQNIGFYKSVL
ncbi:MAG: glycosyltransferase family 4 protein [Jejuia sp.]